MSPKKYISKNDNYSVKRPTKQNWSDYQKEIFRNIAKGKGNTLISARAGSAKTSSLVEGSRYIPKGKKSLFCAFNKSIQEELRAKLGSYVECLTLHSLGLRGVKNKFGNNIEIDNYKCWKLVESFLGNKPDNYDLIDNVVRAVGFCKFNLVDTPAKIENLLLEYNIDLCETKPDVFVKYVCQTLRLCKEYTSSVDFNDMIYFPFVYNIDVGKYDYVFVDEAQDMSKLMIELALSAIKPDGRVIVVMDEHQAIYGFAGADSRVLNNVRTRLNPEELTLPVCYRCPKKVIELAQTIVPDIQAYDKAEEGEIVHIKTTDIQQYAKPGDYVISRLNAPLIKNCFNFLKHGIPSNILGRDIGDGLSYLIKKSKKKKVTDLLKWLTDWEKEEKERLLAKFPKAGTEVIADKADCVRMLCENATSIEEVQNNIKKLFSDDDEKNIVLHSSIHKIKGKEANNVFVFTDTFRFHDEQEFNLQYVAYTRAKKKLYLVNKTGDSTHLFDKDPNELWEVAADGNPQYKKFYETNSSKT